MSSLIAYLPTSSDVIPTPNYDNFVYFQYFDDIAGDDVVVNFNNVFPDGSQITPPYNYAVVLSWSGLTLDDDDNYIPINYNVGETFVKNKSVFLIFCDACVAQAQKLSYLSWLEVKSPLKLNYFI